MDRKQHRKDKAKGYRAEIREYLDKVERGRSVRRVEPHKPEFSEHAEMIRQTDKIDKANAFERRMRER